MMKTLTEDCVISGVEFKKGDVVALRKNRMLSSCWLQRITEVNGILCNEKTRVVLDKNGKLLEFTPTHNLIIQDKPCKAFKKIKIHPNGLLERFTASREFLLGELEIEEGQIIRIRRWKKKTNEPVFVEITLQKRPSQILQQFFDDKDDVIRVKVETDNDTIPETVYYTYYKWVVGMDY